MAATTVSTTADPGRARQLGEEGLFVLWRDAGEPGRREGLACILSMCPHPGCACEDVHVDGHLIDDRAGEVSWDDGGVHVDGPANAADVPDRLSP